MNLYTRQIAAPHIKAGDHGTHGAIGKIHNTAQVRRCFHRDDFTLLGFAGDQALGKRAAGNGGDAGRWTKKRDQRRKIVRPHIEHGTPSRLVIKFRAGMPVLMAVALHECRGGYGHADPPVINDFTRGLYPGAQHRVRRAPHAQVLFGGLFKQRLPLLTRQGQRLFVINMLAGLNGRESNGGMRLRHRNVEDNIHITACQEFFRCQHVQYAVLFCLVPCGGFDNVSAGRNHNGVKPFSPLEIKVRNVAAADDAHIKRFHGVAFHSTTPDRSATWRFHLARHRYKFRIPDLDSVLKPFFGNQYGTKV
ncbi:MAG: hypothetical protein BWY09_03085 [Candidatus Hydrogenedentes bacterium ADurb.Bin179]|nr:MAG: hypothetical protein BWY09_03085 [Candidatus Hydrogenedentes bacterium ADurb.Bin179]